LAQESTLMMYSNKSRLSQFCHSAIAAYLFNGSSPNNFRVSLKKFSLFLLTTQPARRRLLFHLRQPRRQLEGNPQLFFE
jgi:hypothetical protein